MIYDSSTTMVSQTVGPACWSPVPIEVATVRFSRRAGSYSGGRTPGYHKLVKQGALIPHQPYTRWDGRGEGQMTISAHYSNNNDCEGSVVRTGIPVDFDAAMRGSDELFAESGVNTTALLQSALASTLPSLDALTSAAEIPKTLDLVLGARKRAVSLVEKARRGGLKNASEAISDAWLEWRYGWRLLYYDARAVEDLYNNPIRLFVEGRAGTSFASETVVGQTASLLSAPRVFADYNVVARDDLSIRANVNGKIKGSAVNRLNAFGSLPLTMWELVPWSFVVDWFVSVGDAIAAWEATTKADFTCSIGYKRTCDASCVLTGVRTVDWQYTNPSASVTGKWNSVTKKRMPARLPSFKPQTRVNLTTGRCIDAAALLRKRF